MLNQRRLWGRDGVKNQIWLPREYQNPSIPLPLGSSILPGSANHIEGVTADELALTLENQKGIELEILDKGSQIIVHERES